ncbi:MAG: tRNA threonylcarbamoyladenosine dehydratase [Clostridia bacterium]|nr:tRNA threonylcarbamoyladenosine dehydratase [Clostridia bacterium]
MQEQFSRTALVIGSSGVDRLHASRIALFGVGGVGGFAAEALIRSGVGALDIFDNDTVSVSNINRQLIALHSTVGQLKVDVMKKRLLDINHEAEIGAYAMFYLPENADSVDLSRYDYIIDAIDTVSAKIELAVRAQNLNIPIISAMGAGNKLDPTAFEVADISKTSVCPLARVMRQSLKKRGVNHLKVVYSREIPRPHAPDAECPPEEGRRSTPGSTAFCPSVAGLILAGEVIRDLTGL